MVELEAEFETRGFREAKLNLSRLIETVPKHGREATKNSAEKLKDDIQQEVLKKDLVENERNPPLHESFRAFPLSLARSEQTYRIESDHPGARPLEVGASPHPIVARDGMLQWEPSNPADYADSGWLRRLDDGTQVVQIHAVDHPGNRPYEYVADAQDSWKKSLQTEVGEAAYQMITRAGFERGRDNI